MIIRNSKTNTVVDNIQEENDEEKNNILDAPTRLLIESIKCNDFKSAYVAIQNNAKINVLLPMPLRDINNGRKVLTYLTPLQLAVFMLNDKIIKLLLDNGADSNILTSEKQSTLELLLTLLTYRVLDETLKMEEKYTPTLFSLLNIQKEYSTPIKLTRAQISAAEQTLELLLCYGLNPEPPWTETFMRAMTELESALYYQKKHDKKPLKNLLTDPVAAATIVEVGLEEQNASSLKKSILVGLVKGIATAGCWAKKIYDEAKTDKASHDHLNDLVFTLKNIKNQTAILAAEIKQDKAKYIIDLRHHIDDGLKYRFASVLTEIVLEYAIELSASIADKRKSQKQSAHLWLHNDNTHPKLNEKEKENIRELTRYKYRLDFFFGNLYQNSDNRMDQDCIKLISQYAVTPKR